MWTADKVIYRNEDDFVRAYQYDTLVWEKVSQNVIFYTSTDGQLVTPIEEGIPFIGQNNTSANIVSNTYSNGLGIIVLDIPLIKINDNAFWGKTTLKSIVIPSTVTILGDSCFYGCRGMTSVTIPSSVTTIGQSAFATCGLSSITIPSSVTSIGRMGLFMSDTLIEVIMNSTVPPAVGSMVLPYTDYEIVVPASSVQAYKTAQGWSVYASKIVAQ